MRPQPPLARGRIRRMVTPWSTNAWETYKSARLRLSLRSALAAALAIFGALDVPLVYFSIWFFRTQHPQPVIGGGGSIDPRMLHVLLINWLAFLCFAGLLCWSRYRLEMVRRQVEEAQSLESLSEVRDSR